MSSSKNAFNCSTAAKYSVRFSGAAAGWETPPESSRFRKKRVVLVQFLIEVAAFIDAGFIMVDPDAKAGSSAINSVVTRERGRFLLAFRFEIVLFQAMR